MTNRVTCSSCGAPILWCQTHRGKSMPVDPEPCADGNVIVEDGRAEVLKAEHLARLGSDVPRYKSHFATCKFAGQHRRR